MGIFHPAGGKGLGPYADAGGIKRGAFVKRDAVSVDRDARQIKGALGLSTGKTPCVDIHQNEVVVGTAGYQVKARRKKFLGEGFGVGDSLGSVGCKTGLKGLMKGDCFGGNDMHQRPTLKARENGLIDLGAPLLFGEDKTRPRPPKGFVGCGGDKIREGDGTGVLTARDKARDVGHIHHEQGAIFLTNLGKTGEIDDARIGTGPGYNKLGFVLLAQGGDLVIIDASVGFFDPIMVDFVKLPGKIQVHSVGQMPPVGQVHGHDRITWLQRREIDGHVGGSAGMGLDIGEWGVKKFHGPVNSQLFGLIHIFTTAVIALARVAFRIFVGENGPLRRKDGRGGVIFRSDHFQPGLLAFAFVL